MAESIPSLARVHDLLRELRLGIRRVEVVEKGTAESNDDAWTRQSIEVKCDLPAVQNSCFVTAVHGPGCVFRIYPANSRNRLLRDQASSIIGDMVLQT